MMAEQETIDLRDFPEPFRNQLSSLDAKDEELVSLEELQRKHMLRVLGARWWQPLPRSGDPWN
jgi:hypothetical protein